MTTLTGFYLPLFPSLRAVLWNIALFIGVLALCVLIAALDAFITLFAPSAIASVLTTVITIALYCAVRYADAIPARVCSGAYWSLVGVFIGLVTYAAVTGVFTQVLA